MKTTGLIALFLLINIGLKAQSPNSTKRDTLYYLVDTSKTPKSDRILEIEHARGFTLYTIDCPCYGAGWKPQFYYVFDGYIIIDPDSKSHYFAKGSLKEDNNLKPPSITTDKVKKLSLTSLSKLIALSCENGTRFSLLHTIFFIEHIPDGRYIMTEVKSNAPPIVNELH